MGPIRLHFILVAFCAAVCLVEGNVRAVNRCGLRGFIEGKGSRKSIVGGTPTVLGHYPWMVSIQANVGSSIHHCGGVIINKYWIVTAAHCFIQNEINLSNKTSLFDIYVGAHKLSSKNRGEGKVYKVEKIIIHENYDERNISDDIALVRTTKPLNINGDNGLVNNICLPPKDEEPTGWAIVAGWGHTRYKGKGTDVLHDVEVPLVWRDRCAYLYRMRTMPKSVICAGGEYGKGSCQGDSGGALMQRIAGRYTLIGIVSAGIGCGNQIPVIFMKVSAYIDWMNAKIKAA